MDRRQFLIGVSALMPLGGCAGGGPSSGGQAASGLSAAMPLAETMLGLVNRERDRRGLAPMRLERHLTMAALDHGAWVFETNQFRHYPGRNGSTPKQRMETAGFDLQGNWLTGENITINSLRGADDLQDDIADAHQRLMDSPVHRDNILHQRFEYIGIGPVVGEFDYDNGYGALSSLMVTQKFATTTGRVAVLA